MCRDSESDSEDSSLSSSDSSLSKVLEHAGEQSLSPSTLTSSSEDAVEDFGSVEPCRFDPLTDSSSSDELPSSAYVDEHSERLSDMSW